MNKKKAILIDDDVDDLNLLKEMIGEVDQQIDCLLFQHPSQPWSIWLLTTRLTT